MSNYIEEADCDIIEMVVLKRNEPQPGGQREFDLEILIEFAVFSARRQTHKMQNKSRCSSIQFALCVASGRHGIVFSGELTF